MRLSRWVLAAVVVAVIVVSVAVAMSAKAEKARLGKPVHVRHSTSVSGLPGASGTSAIRPETRAPGTPRETTSRAPERTGAPRVTKPPPVAGDDDDHDDDDYWNDDDRGDDAGDDD